MRRQPAIRLLATCLSVALLLQLPASRASAITGVSTAAVPDSAFTVTSSPNTLTPFNRYRVPRNASARAWRDLEFFWSETYRALFQAVPPDSQTAAGSDLDQFGTSFADLLRNNPFGLPKTNIQLIYEYFGVPENTRNPVYDFLPNDPVGFLSYDPTTTFAPDRNHADVYLFLGPNTVTGYSGDPNDPGSIPTNSQFPSKFFSPVEDTSSGHPSGSADRWNAIEIRGPVPSAFGQTGPGRWCRPSNSAVKEHLSHEFGHMINFDGFNVGSDGFTFNGFYELFQTGAEILGGWSSDPPINDAPYTWSLLHQNEPAWASFAAYLMFNFLGTDTALASFSDDLFHRWAGSPYAQRHLSDLGNLLTDTAFPEGRLPYFAGLSSIDRLNVLLNNWRVATYVNNFNLADHQYGIDPRFGFSPAPTLGLWQDIDTSGTADNSIVLPSDTTLGTGSLTREVQYSARPAKPGIAARRFVVPVFGSEVCVVRAAPALSSTDQALIVRVSTDSVASLNRSTYGPPCTTATVKDAKMFASVISYSASAESLYVHPEYATGVITQSVALDKATGELTLTVPHFGSTTKAAVVVVTLGDGPTAYYSKLFDNEISVIQDNEGVPVRFAFQLRRASAPAADVTVLTTSNALTESHPAWTPDGQSIAFEARGSSGVGQILKMAATAGAAASPISPGTRDQFTPDCSPDGKWIAFAQDSVPGRGDVYVYSTASHLSSRLTHQAGLVRSPAFRPDGTGLVYVRYSSTSGPPPAGMGDLQCLSCYAEVRKVDLSTGSDVALSAPLHGSPVNGTAPTLSTPRWSPDGRWVYFMALPGGNAPAHFYQLAADGSRLLLRDDLARNAVSVAPALGNGYWALEQAAADTVRDLCGALATDQNYCCGGSDHVQKLYPFHRLALQDTLAKAPWQRFFDGSSAFSDPAWSPDGTRLVYAVANGSATDLAIGQASYNRAPAFSALADTYYPIACQSFRIDFTTSDPDGEFVTVVGDNLPPGARMSSNISFIWPSPVEGTYVVTLRALDPSGGTSRKIITLSVSDQGLCGGGGMMASTIAGAGTGASPGWSAETGVLRQSGVRTSTHDMARFRVQPLLTNGQLQVRLRHVGDGSASLDRVRLVKTSYGASDEAFACDGAVHVGHRDNVASAALRGAEIADSLAADASSPALLNTGDTLEVALASGGAAGYAFALVGERLDDPTLTGADVSVFTRDAAGAWTPLRDLTLPPGADAAVIENLVSPAVRIVAAHAVQIDHLSRFSLGTPTASQATTSTLATNVAGADVHAQLGAVDQQPYELATGDTLMLSFAGGTSTADRASWFLEVEGANLSGLANRVQRLPGADANAIHETRLLPARPNPFAHTTTLMLELAARGRVRIELYDLQGRRVREVFDGVHESGRWSFAWDGQGSDGRSVRAGVYLVRVQAGERTFKQRLTVLP